MPTPASARLDLRLAGLIVRRRPFTADDLTDSGRLTIDETHGPNGKQSAIGAIFSRARKDGLIVPTGEFVSSRAPRRKGGAIRVWRGTEAGHSWAVERHARRTPDVEVIQLPFPEESVRTVR